MIAIIILLSGCRTKPSGVSRCIHFDFTQEMKDVHTMGLLKDCTIVPLETNDSVLIGEIDKVIFYETRLYVATFSPEQAVYIFNLQGKLLHKISRKGRGAEEYLQLSDMFIDSRNRTLYLLSRIDEKLLVFDVDEYRLVKTIRLPKAFVKMVSLENGYIGYMGNYSQDKNQPYNLWAMNSRYEIESQYMKIDSRWESKMASIHSLSTYQDSLYYIAPTDFNIYRCQGKDMCVDHTVRFGKFHLPAEQLSYDEYKEYTRNPDYITTIEKFQETPDFYIYWVLAAGQNRLCLYNKNNRESQVCELTAYTGKYFISFGRMIDITSDYIITSVSASDMCTYLKGGNEYVNFEEKYPKQIQRMREEFSGIQEDSNPCIVIYSF